MSDALTVKLETERKVFQVLSDYLKVNRRTIELDCRLVEDFYIDSIGLVEVVMALNQAFGVELPEDAVEQWKIVMDICTSLECAVG